VIAMWGVRDMIVLANVHNLRISFTITWVIAQRFHANFFTFVDHDVVVIAIPAPIVEVYPNALERVIPRLGSVFSR